MDNALDVFRAQQAAAAALHKELLGIQSLVSTLRADVHAVGTDADIRTLLARQEAWLASVTRAVADVERLRHLEAHWHWRGVVRRWVIAVGFALTTVLAFGVGHNVVDRWYGAQDQAVQLDIDFGRYVRARRLALRPAERRQLDRLLQLTQETPR